MRFFFNRRGPRGDGHDADIDRLVSSALKPLKETPAETHRQWSRLERAIDQPGISSAGRVDRPAIVQRTLRPARARFALATASVAVAGIALLLFSLPPHGRQAPSRFTTSRGEQLSVTLPDSSEVILNHTSALEFDPSGFRDTRAVTLTGEAFFRIRKSDAPFTVATGAGSVTVTGTRFNVRVRDDRYQVGVTEGSVRTLVDLPGKDTAVSLAAGQVLQGVRNIPPPPVRAMEYTGYPGWTERKLMFTSMDIRSVCEELRNTFDVEITIENSALAGTSISGVFEARDIGSVLSTLCALTGGQYRHENGKYILY